MDKSNGVHGPVTAAVMANYGGPYREEHDTLPEITIDLEETKTYARPVKLSLLGRLRAWAARGIVRLACRLMP